MGLRVFRQRLLFCNKSMEIMHRNMPVFRICGAIFPLIRRDKQNMLNGRASV